MNHFAIVEEENEFPLEINQWISSNKEKEGYVVIEEEEHTYVVISRGEKSTGGYTINVNEVEDQEEWISIKVEYINPDPMDMVMQIITYPVIVIRMERTEKTIKLEIENKDNIDNGNINKDLP